MKEITIWILDALYCLGRCMLMGLVFEAMATSKRMTERLAPSLRSTPVEHLEIELQSGPLLSHHDRRKTSSHMNESDVLVTRSILWNDDQDWRTHGNQSHHSSRTSTAARIRGVVRLTGKQLTGPEELA